MMSNRAVTDEELLLNLLPEIGGKEPPPAQVIEAKALWERSVQDAERGNLIAAAAGFMSVAEKLRLDPSDRYARDAERVRCLAYDNAITCWRSARAYDQARRRLIVARAQDPACAPIIDAALKSMPIPN
jgi:hypothetical protein